MLSLFAVPLTREEQLALIKRKLDAILGACHPSKVFLIGSASRGQMTVASDVDFILVIADHLNQQEILKAISLARKGDDWPQDVLLIGESDFKKKSTQGGIYWIAAEEGIEVFPEFKLQ